MQLTNGTSLTMSTRWEKELGTVTTAESGDISAANALRKEKVRDKKRVKAKVGELVIFNKKDGLGKAIRVSEKAVKMVRVRGKVSRANVGTVASPATDLANAGTSGKCPQKP